MGAPQAEHVDPLLSELAIDYWNTGFQAKVLFPDAPVNEVSGIYLEYERKAGFVVTGDVMSADGEANEVKFKTTSKTFSCIPHGEKTGISAITKVFDRGQGKLVSDRERKATEQVMTTLQRNFEYAVARKATTQTNYPVGNRFAQLSAWDADTEIVSVIEDAANACVLRANTMLIGWDAWKLIKANKNLLTLRAAGERGILSTDFLKDIFDLDNVIVAKAQMWGKTEYPYIWADNIVLAYVTEPAPEGAAFFGATFQVDGGIQIRNYREEKRGGGSDIIEGLWYYDPEIVCSDCGALISGVATAGS